MKTQCPECKTIYRIGDGQAGKTARCTKCDTRFKAEKFEEPAPPTTPADSLQPGEGNDTNKLDEDINWGEGPQAYKKRRKVVGIIVGLLVLVSLFPLTWLWGSNYGYNKAVKTWTSHTQALRDHLTHAYDYHASTGVESAENMVVNKLINELNYDEAEKKLQFELVKMGLCSYAIGHKAGVNAYAKAAEDWVETTHREKAVLALKKTCDVSGGFQCKNVSFKDDGYGNTKVFGEIVNNSGRSMQFANFRITCYDGEGAILDIDDVILIDFLHKQTRTFEASFDISPSIIADYKIDFEIGH